MSDMLLIRKFAGDERYETSIFSSNSGVTSVIAEALVIRSMDSTLGFISQEVIASVVES